jgi:hypothetical protein
MKWEYKSIKYEEAGLYATKVATTDEPDKQLNRMGAEGWELVATLHPTTTGVLNLFIFKRPIPAS